MNNMNQIILEGRCVRNAEIKETPSGSKVSTVCVAVIRDYRNAQGEKVNEVCYFDVKGFGDNFASLYERKCRKGKPLRVIGRLKQERWKDDDGKAYSKVYVIAEHIDFPETEEESKEEE